MVASGGTRFSASGLPTRDWLPAGSIFIALEELFISIKVAVMALPI